MKEGQHVRLKSDPSRTGIISGLTRERRGLVLHKVNFANGPSYVAEDLLELMREGPQDPLDLLESGRLSTRADLARSITHVRLTGRLANVIYSMETTDTDFYAYQFKPVLKLLNSPSSGILIADEVGLGKTIEAGLIWTELRSRFDFKKLMVICPAMLRQKWQRELSLRFGVDADILDAKSTLDKLQVAGADPIYSSFHIIASMQGLRPNKKWDEDKEDKDDYGASTKLARFLSNREHEEPLIDLLIIDEAHYLRNRETKTAELGRLARRVAQYVVLLSATPVHLGSQDLYQLLNLVDEDNFNQPQMFDNILEANAPLVSARDYINSGKAVSDDFIKKLELAKSHPLLQGSRQLSSLLDNPPSESQLRNPTFVSHLSYQLDTVNLLGYAITRMKKRDIIEWRVVRMPKPEIICLTPVERAFYDAVTLAVKKYCMKRNGPEGLLLATPQRQVASSMPAALRHWKKRETKVNEQIYEDIGIEEEINDQTIGPLVQELIEKSKDFGDLSELIKNDTKYNRLKELVSDYFDHHKNQKIVLFSYFRETLQYLLERLQEDGITCFLLRGGGKNKKEGYIDKDSLIEQFKNYNGSAILLSSEVGSEGIDLQFCWLLVNYDLPWNPMKVEQRIGRLDRLGQASNKIIIWNLFYEDTIDSRIYEKLYERLKIFEHSLGAIEPILGGELQKLTFELLSKGFTKEEEEERIEQTAQALANNRRHEEDLEEKASHLVAYGDYILNEVNAAKELSRCINARDLETYVIGFFKSHFQGCIFQQKENDTAYFEINLTNEVKHQISEFIKLKKIKSNTSLISSYSRSVSCKFENTAIAVRQGRIEIISQFHPIVRYVSHCINRKAISIRPAASISIQRNHLKRDVNKGVYVYTIQHWSIKALQDVERLFYSVINYETEKSLLTNEDEEYLIVSAMMDGGDWLEASGEVDLNKVSQMANNICLGNSDEAYENYIEGIAAQNEDRADVQLRTLDTHFKNQMEKLNATRKKHEILNRKGLAKATEGKMNAMKNRVDRARIKINDRRQIIHDNTVISVGLIKVT